MGNKATEHKKLQRERKKERERFALYTATERLRAIGCNVTVCHAEKVGVVGDGQLRAETRAFTQLAADIADVERKRENVYAT